MRHRLWLLFCNNVFIDSAIIPQFVYKSINERVIGSGLCPLGPSLHWLWLLLAIHLKNINLIWKSIWLTQILNYYYCCCLWIRRSLIRRTTARSVIRLNRLIRKGVKSTNNWREESERKEFFQTGIELNINGTNQVLNQPKHDIQQKRSLFGLLSRDAYCR